MSEPPRSSASAQRLRRLRRAAWLLDRSIPLGGGLRIGLDPLIGLVPGLGDWLGAALSVYLIYEAACLGLPLPVLARMGLNVLIESLVGAVPLAGDLFDFVWQANMRNLRLVERHYHASLRPRSFGRIWLGLGAFTLLLLALIAAAVVALFAGIASLFN